MLQILKNQLINNFGQIINVISYENMIISRNSIELNTELPTGNYILRYFTNDSVNVVKLIIR
jgi:hypothetical protein